jgi:hypothetical protein
MKLQHKERKEQFTSASHLTPSVQNSFGKPFGTIKYGLEIYGYNIDEVGQ